MASQDHCVICDCRTKGQTLCYVHEPYRGCGQRTLDRLRDEHEVAEVYASRADQPERDATRELDPRTDEQIARDEWAGGDHGAALIRRVILARTKAGLPCLTERLAGYDAALRAYDYKLAAAKAYLASPSGTPPPAILAGDL